METRVCFQFHKGGVRGQPHNMSNCNNSIRYVDEDDSVCFFGPSNIVLFLPVCVSAMLATTKQQESFSYTCVGQRSMIVLIMGDYPAAFTANY